MKAKGFKLALGLLMVTALVGCAAATTAFTKRTLEVQTSMSGTVFFDPDNRQDRTVFIEVRDTSGVEKHSALPDLKALLVEELRQRGYTLTTNRVAAHYSVQANVLQIGKVAPTALQQLRTLHYGTPLSNVAWDLEVKGGVSTPTIAGIGEWASGLLVRDVTFTVVIDLKLSQRLSAGRGHKEHYLRVVSAANQFNLSFEKAWHALCADLARSIAGILA